ncbi:MAG: carboxypeptidase M32, partial [Candidatus Thorarchaeota archaeon]|nr:carboxypeptidase M32 [Candidatus Thorarchaeota archaeon]
GNMYSGMILERMEKDIPNWKEGVSKGNIAPVIKWLNAHVHKPSNRYDPSRMIEEITGKKITAEPFIKYLEKKYSSLYS